MDDFFVIKKSIITNGDMYRWVITDNAEGDEVVTIELQEKEYKEQEYNEELKRYTGEFKVKTIMVFYKSSAMCLSQVLKEWSENVND